MTTLVLERTGKSYETPYNKPEAYGLEQVAVIQWGEQNYDFDLTCVLRRVSDGTLWYASDAGCSCPSPFEDDFEWDRLFNIEPLEALAKEKEALSDPDYTSFLADVKAAFDRLKEGA